MIGLPSEYSRNPSPFRSTMPTESSNAFAPLMSNPGRDVLALTYVEAWIEIGQLPFTPNPPISVFTM